MVWGVFGIAPSQFLRLCGNKSLDFCSHCFSLFWFVFVSTATGSGHYGLLRRGSGAGGNRRDVLQQLLPLLALSAGPGRHSRPKPVGTQREARPGEIHTPLRCSDPVIPQGRLHEHNGYVEDSGIGSSLIEGAKTMRRCNSRLYKDVGNQAWKLSENRKLEPHGLGLLQQIKRCRETARDSIQLCFSRSQRRSHSILH